MNEELAQLDADLKGLFTENKLEEVAELLNCRQDQEVKEISSYNWNIIKKYYDMERYELLFSHFKFVAYTCFVVEYTHQKGLISDEAFLVMMQVYQTLLDIKRQQS